MLKKGFILFLWLLFCHTAWAVSNVDPYQLQIPSSGQLDQDQQQAFKQLIVRVTGSDQALTNPVIEKAESKAGNYLQQYAYLQQNGQSMISVQFNRLQIEKVLTEAKVRFWGVQRPLMVIWDVKEHDGQRDFVADGSDEGDVLRQQAQQYALPVLLPVMDLDDSMVIRTSDVWGGFTAPVIQASHRYAADIALLIKQYADVDKTQILDWQLLDLRTSQSLGSGQQRSLELGQNIQADMWAAVADALAAHFAVVRSDTLGERIELTFTQVNDFSEYHQIDTFLSTQPSVGTSQLIAVSGHDYTFSVQLLSQWQELKNALDLTGEFKVDPQNPYLYQYQSDK
ncbi:DUF2066 domain-containing protein [Celerinatantimonas sp. YJH-8]|uniref:DUF2066 domain-containing protein n=1 Tax=Celerinatantimonas sp. YJH-8 TaxID=3228714 RepID=UPI0038BF51E1